MSDLIKYNQNNLLRARIAQALGREMDHVGEDVKTRPASLVIRSGFKAEQPSSIAQEGSPISPDCAHCSDGHTRRDTSQSNIGGSIRSVFR